jgi:tetratricopeptide (TPR) repeat protein
LLGGGDLHEARSMSGDDDEARWDAAAGQLDEAAEALSEGRVADAHALASEAASELFAVVGDRHPDFGNALQLLGEIAQAAGDVREAANRFDAALAIFDLGMGEAPEICGPMRRTALELLARTRVDVGRHGDAEVLLHEAIRQGEREGDLSAQARSHQALGVVLRFAGRYDEAEREYERAAELRLAAGEPLGPDHFHNLAGLALARGDARASEVHARKAIELREHEDFGLATDLCGLADALAEQGRADEAEPLYRRALAIHANGERAQHAEVAYALHNLADALVDLGRFEEAETSYRASLERKIASFGPGTPDEAGTRNNLAALLVARGRLDEARAESALACAMVRKRLSPEHPIRVACETLARQLHGEAIV